MSKDVTFVPTRHHLSSEKLSCYVNEELRLQTASTQVASVVAQTVPDDLASHLR